jgi:hypothetical protein
MNFEQEIPLPGPSCSTKPSDLTLLAWVNIKSERWSSNEGSASPLKHRADELSSPVPSKTRKSDEDFRGDGEEITICSDLSFLRSNSDSDSSDESEISLYCYETFPSSP